MQTAIGVAKAVVDTRLEGMNLLREQINQERGRYVEREMYDQRHEELRQLLESRSREFGIRLDASENRQTAAQAEALGIDKLKSRLYVSSGIVISAVLGIAALIIGTR